MALLSASPPTTIDTSLQSSIPTPQPTNPMLPSWLVPTLHSGSGPLRMPSSKLPKGRHLSGDRVLYDIDVRLPGEVQPQLEVTPITKYASDPGLVLGRQIAVNKTYVCYGLKLGAIRVLNANTAFRSLLKGLAQRVTDMVFFAEDVHLLASASIDGRVYVWKITEVTDEDDKPQITGKIVVAIKIVGEGESVYPRVCWHCRKQEVLVVGIGKRVLRIDTTKVGRGEVYSAEEPLKCSVDKLINGVQLVGSHDGEVTDLSICQWMTTRLVSASVDGTIKIWDDRKSTLIAVLTPHDGLPVNSVTFLTAPQRPDHIILITGGPLNREIKIWVSDSEEGWLLPSDADSWHCSQTLELKSSSEPRIEDAFFNQVVGLSQGGLLLLANGKKNAIYVVHLEYGPNPEATHMDYIAEFTVTMPILSFTGTSDLLPYGEQIVEVYCVHTQAIHQYALDMSQCLPPPIRSVAYDQRSDSTVSRDVIAPSTEEVVTRLESSGSKTEIPLPVSHSNMSNDSKIDESKDGAKFKHPTHLVTPAELMATLSSEISHVSEQKNDLEANIQDVVLNPDSQNAEVEVKVGKSQNLEPVSPNEILGFAKEQMEKSFSSQASDFRRGDEHLTFAREKEARKERMREKQERIIDLQQQLMKQYVDTLADLQMLANVEILCKLPDPNLPNANQDVIFELQRRIHERYGK